MATNEAVDLWVRGLYADDARRELRVTGDTLESAVSDAVKDLLRSGKGIRLGHPGGYRITDVTVTDEGKATEWYLRVVITTEETDNFPDMTPGRVRRTVLAGKHVVPTMRRTWTIKRGELVDGESLEMHTHTTSPAEAVLESVEFLRNKGMLHGEYRPHATPYAGASISTVTDRLRHPGRKSFLVGIYTWVDDEPVRHEFEVCPVLDRGGRPSVDGEPGRTKTAAIALGDELTGQADAAAAAAGISRAELVRRAVAAYIQTA